MESEWKPVIVWFCLGLFALAEFGNVQMGGEIRRMCALVGDPVTRPQAAAEEIGAICANRVPDDAYMARLEARQYAKLHASRN
jgi:hypothetical protein